MAKWKVNEGTQVFFDGKLYESGDSFEASDDEAAPFASWVTKSKAASSDTKAQKASDNKAQQSSSNKSSK